MKRQQPQKQYGIGIERPCRNGVFDPVNECIYCGSQSSNLTLEHILMYALGGQMTLPKSSCRLCAKEIGRVEQFVARDMWGGARAALQLPTRNKGSNDAGYPLIAGIAGTMMVKFKMPVDKLPFYLHCPVLPEPEFFTKKPLNEFTSVGFGGNPELFKPFNGQRVYLGAVNLQTFARFLAKSAHAFARAKFGNTFTPLLIDAILGRHPQPANFVGSLEQNLPPDFVNQHRFQLVNLEQSGFNYIAAKIRLFSQLGTPQYTVVVGHNDGALHPVFARILAEQSIQ